MLTEEDYVEIKGCCVMAIDALDDALNLCKRFSVDKVFIDSFKRTRKIVKKVEDMCNDLSDEKANRSPFLISNRNCDNDTFVELIEFKYDVEGAHCVDAETQEEYDEQLPYELLGGIIFAIRQEIYRMIEIMEYSEDEKLEVFLKQLKDAERGLF